MRQCGLNVARPTGPLHASVKRSSRALQAPAGTSSRSSGGNGKGNGGADLRKASVEELLSGVTYWRAQQMREHNAGPAAPPSHPYEDTPPPPPLPPPPSPPVATEGAAAMQQQQQQQQHVNGSSDGSTGDALAPQPPAPSTSPGALPAAASGEASEGEWQLDAASSGREASEALTAYASAMARRQPVPVHFCLKFRAQMGQRVKVVGACEQLGSWSLAHAPELHWREGNTWHATVPLPAGSVTEYKYVLLDNSGTRVMAWQDGNNSLLAVRLAESAVTDGLSVLDDWYAGPSGKLAVGGGTPAARDHRLQTWAGDLYAQLEDQRQDLRRSRMEMAGVQQEAAAARLQAKEALAQLAEREAVSVAAVEEARAARLELERVRAQLTEREVERAEAVCGQTMAKTMNEVLQQQLSDTTATLREAIELLSRKQMEEEEQHLAAAAAAAAAAEADTASEGAALVPAPRKRRAPRQAAAATAEAADPAVAEAGAPAIAAAGEAPAGEVVVVKAARTRRTKASIAAAAAAAAAATAAADEGGNPTTTTVLPAAEAAPAVKATRTRKPRVKAASAAVPAEGAVKAAAELRLDGEGQPPVEPAVEDPAVEPAAQDPAVKPARARRVRKVAAAAGPGLETP